MEVVVAMTLFGIIMSGLFDFMANQAQAVAKLNEHNKLMYHMQKFVYSGKWTSSEDKALGVTFKWNESGQYLSVNKTGSSGDLMTVYLDAK